MRRQVVFSVAFVAVALVGFRYAAKSQETDHDLLRKIEEARKAVKKEAVHIIYGVVGTRRVRVSRHRYRDEPITGIVGREMAIAVMDESGAITVARAVKDDSGLEVKTSGVLLYLRRENGINSDIACERPANGKVLAVKYPVSNEGNRFGPGPEEIEAVYTPYSGEIRSEEVIKRGVDVQREFIDKAYAKLRSRGVGSRAFEGKAVADVISKDTVTVLLMN
ncbi:MAG TPA: hypothetical protein VJX67_01860, partial [Blastocatellia bacterium]|nr:hypothetical protein [Blastocatellia bacterium]